MILVEEATASPAAAQGAPARSSSYSESERAAASAPLQAGRQVKRAAGRSDGQGRSRGGRRRARRVCSRSTMAPASGAACPVRLASLMELRGARAPPALVVVVMHAACVLVDEPGAAAVRPGKLGWSAVLRALAEPRDFYRRLMDAAASAQLGMPAAKLHALDEFARLDAFFPERVKAQSVAAEEVCRAVLLALSAGRGAQQSGSSASRSPSPPHPLSPRSSNSHPVPAPASVCASGTRTAPAANEFQREYLHPARMQAEIERLLGEVAQLESAVAARAREAHELKRRLESSSREADATVVDVQVLLQLVKEAAQSKQLERQRHKQEQGQPQPQMNGHHESKDGGDDVFARLQIEPEALDKNVLDRYVEEALHNLLDGAARKLETLQSALSPPASPSARPAASHATAKADLGAVARAPLPAANDTLALFRKRHTGTGHAQA